MSLINYEHPGLSGSTITGRKTLYCTHSSSLSCISFLKLLRYMYETLTQKFSYILIFICCSTLNLIDILEQCRHSHSESVNGEQHITHWRLLCLGCMYCVVLRLLNAHNIKHRYSMHM